MKYKNAFLLAAQTSSCHGRPESEKIKMIGMFGILKAYSNNRMDGCQ